MKVRGGWRLIVIGIFSWFVRVGRCTSWLPDRFIDVLNAWPLAPLSRCPVMHNFHYLPISSANFVQWSLNHSSGKVYAALCSNGWEGLFKKTPTLFCFYLLLQCFYYLSFDSYYLFKFFYPPLSHYSTSHYSILHILFHKTLLLW